MKFWKYAAFLALAVIPFILLKKNRQEESNEGREVDSDEIFSMDLRTE
jgi:hypothetical protein